jgi:DNA mismatch repair protein MutS
MDVSTGEFRLFSAYDQQHVLNVVEIFQPKEVLVQEGVSFELPDFVLQTVRSFSNIDRARQTLCSFFGLTSLSAFGIESYAPAFPAAAALVDYVSYTHRSELKHVTGLIGYRTQAFMAVDATTLRSLDVLVPTFDTVRQGSLFDILNHTRTSMGARLLKQRLRQPLLDPDEIVRRLDAVDVLKEDLLSREEIREVLKQVYDLERLVGRISAGTDNPKDCLALYQSLKGCLDVLPILNFLD